MPDFSPTYLHLNQLLLDPNNYRFHEDQEFVLAAEQRFHEGSVQDVAWRRLRDDGIQELKKSLLKNGFMPMEPLVVREYGHLQDHFVVVEGNRRLAALRWIRRDINAGLDVTDGTETMLQQIPVVVVSHEEDDPAFFEALMGVRHISGTKEWGGYQRAKLVVTLRDERNMESAEIADRVGMSTVEVNRRYRAYKALQQMQDDEEFAEYAKPELYALFHEAVSLPIVREWLGWDAATSTFTKDELVEFYTLISALDSDDGRQEAKIRGYRDVRELKSILPNEEARAVLLDSDRPFVEAVAIAKEEELSRAWTAKVDAAYNALQKLGFREFTTLSEANIEKLRRVSQLAETIISACQQLRSTEEGE